MIFKILGRAFAVVMKKPIKLWGISLMAVLFNGLAMMGFGAVPGVFFCISMLLSVGSTMVFLHGYRGEDVKTLQLFDAFRDKETVKRVLIGMSWMSLWVFLWGLIPFAGPIIAAIKSYQYRLTPYILVQEPDVKPTEAYKLSKERTKGYFWKMVLADLLVYAVVYTAMLIIMLLSLIPKAGPVIAFLLGLPMILIFAILPLYFGLVQAAFYEEITNPTIEVAPPVALVEPVAPVAPEAPVAPAPEVYVAPTPVVPEPVPAPAPAPEVYVAPTPVVPEPVPAPAPAPEVYVAPTPVVPEPVSAPAPAPEVYVAPTPVVPEPVPAPVVPEPAPAPAPAPEPVQRPAGKYCPNCGTFNDAGALFCAACGTRIG